MLPPIECGASLEVAILPDGRQLMLHIDSEYSATNDPANRADVKQDRLEGEWKEGRNIFKEQPEIRQASGEHNAKTEVN
jgi:hypothetical protein